MKTNYITQNFLANGLTALAAITASFLLSFNLSAQTWTIYNKGNSGLPNDSLNYVTVDGAGIKWIGSGKGLTKFDGTTWYTYNTGNSGLYNNLVKQIVIDGSGNKWITSNYGMSTFPNGVTKFDGTNWMTYNKGNSGLNTNVIISIAFDKFGNGWFATDSGLTKLSGTTWTNYKLPNAFSKGANQVNCDAQGNVWIASFFNGIYKFNGTTWTQFLPSNTNNGLPTDQTISVVIDASGNAWIGCWMGSLVKYDGTTWTKQAIPMGGYAFKVIIDNIGNKWLSQNGGAGLQVFDDSGSPKWYSYTNSNSPLPYDYGNVVALDINGDKWVTTGAGGIAKISGNPTGVQEIGNLNSFNSYPNPFSSVTSIHYTLLNSSAVSLLVYNLLGEEVMNFANNEIQSAGEHTYNLKIANAGVYIVKLVCGDKVMTQRIISAE